MKSYLLFLAPMLALATASASAQNGHVTWKPDGSYYCFDSLPCKVPTQREMRLHKPWKFDCDATGCPDPMPKDHYQSQSMDTGKREECHGYTGNCREIPGQKEPACKSAKESTWYQTCVLPFLHDPGIIKTAPEAPASTDSVITVTTISAPEGEAILKDPTMVDGYRVYSLSVKPEWTCRASTNSIYGTSATVITLTCVKFEAVPESRAK